MILIIGSNGQLGRQMQKKLTENNRDFKAYDFPDIDITDPSSVEKLVAAVKPATIVNCAGYTNVNKAESDEENAYKINALGTKYLAEICCKRDIEFVHISTDYVFGGIPILEKGVPRAYIETDECNPNTAYGRTKLEGEKFVQAVGNKWYILRTAWLYGDGNNFVRTMLNLAESHDEVRVVDDQIGSPTSTVDLANAICELIGTGEYGLYHATCEGQCSWFDFTKRIFKIRGINTKIIPVTTEEYPTPAKRPKWSVLENALLKSINKNVFRNWEEAIEDYLK